MLTLKQQAFNSGLTPFRLRESTIKTLETWPEYKEYARLQNYWEDSICRTYETTKFEKQSVNYKICPESDKERAEIFKNSKDIFKASDTSFTRSYFY
jgi:hypothetical protein